MTASLLNEDQRDCLQEIANVAMGQSADRLARLLDVFVVLSIPNVSVLTPNDVAMTLNSLQALDGHEQQLTGVCQGFIGDGIAGEALLIFNGTDYRDLAQLLKYDNNAENRSEILMDTTNVLGGACLHSLAQQLDTHFSLGSPTLLGEHYDIPDLLNKREVTWKNALVVEINYTIEDHRVNCDLLLVISENCIDGLLEKLNYLLD
ncbi:histidine kinase [Gilvimarinus agarilyticus]|uniref:histidine kinase n=1 Tax=unclassified Gilvimarinus TaxID=2642066 RepID=UPI001C09BB59|nr:MULTISPECIES: histidine kinase [unclassified Gilvimarinus]MBU2887070.1 histidine kinase [Gilvimarinus agarilyticus]MDO6571729.1 histidine kinase [Gilvimarinus sp. 2_MG-2023]MDO6745801.1 histidine kinase [Gilvimarinus sp. 1_MG-2023]